MALVNFQTMGTGLETVEFAAVGGTNSMVTSPVWTNSTYSFRCNPATTATGFAQINGFGTAGSDAVYSIATTYVSLYFQYAVAPAAGDEPILQIRQATNTKFEVRINSTGKLYGYNSALTLVASGTTALSANTWYRLDLKVGSSATVGAYELKINNVAEWSGTTNTLAANGTNTRIGKHTNRNSNTVDFYYGPVVIDDANYVSDPNFYVATLLPNTNGSTMDWTSGTGASDYTQVNEIPPSNTNYVKNSGASAGQVALFGFQNRADKSMDNNATFYAVKARIRIAEDIAATASTNIRVRSGGVNSNGATFDGSATFISVSRLLSTDPATSAAWTGSAIDAIEAGAIENNAVSDRLSWAAVDVLYTIPVLPNTSDSVTISESISYYSDAVITSESAALTLAHNVNTSDSTTVTDTPGVLIPFFVVNAYDIVGSDPPKFIYTTDGDVLIYVFKSGTKWFYEKI